MIGTRIVQVLMVVSVVSLLVYVAMVIRDDRNGD